MFFKKNWTKSIDLWIILAILFYFISAKLGLILSFENTGVSPLWPPPGLAFALIILLGYRIWPAITIGSLIAYFLWFLHIGEEISVSLIYSAVFASVGSSIEALLGYYLFQRFMDNTKTFSKTRHSFIFVYITVFISLIGALIVTSSLVSGNVTPREEMWSFFLSSWIGNVVSILVITPFIISWTTKHSILWQKQFVAEFVVFALAIVGVVVLLNIDSAYLSVSRALPFIVIPFLLWLAFRTDFQATMTGLLLIAFSSIYFTTTGRGPFYLASEDSSIVLLQIFISIVAITTLILYSTTKERRDTQVELEDFNEKLESMVEERTVKLEQEIERRKRMEENTRITNRRLRKANAELDNFVYSVSHDLRAPIASVLGLVSLGRLEKTKEGVLDILDKIGKSAEQQDSFIRDILDLSRNSRLSVQKDKIMFDEMINDTFEHLKYSTHENQLLKKIKVVQKEPFINDKRRIKVILNNLISNAIRYSNGDKPMIDINVEVKDQKVNMRIKDNGIGIGKEHHAKIFKMFYRATDRGAGSGLGLYIVKETLEKLDGNITVESDHNKGTTMELEIPELKQTS